jgi:hypothetical protein
MKSDTLAIRLLAGTAAMLLLALVLVPKPATAEAALKDGDYLVCTFPTTGSSDALYIAETRQWGTIAVFVYDSKARGLVPQSVRPIDQAFVPR